MPAQSKKSKQSRFPVARIKRIMQLDEEVGKLASATPVMISKSLECFLQLLIDETCKETKARGSKKMTAYHLKHMINTNETFDFLREVVEPIPDPTTVELKSGAGAGAGPSSSKRKVSDSGAAFSNEPPRNGNGNGAAPKKRGRKPSGYKQEASASGEVEVDDVPELEVGQAGKLPSIGTWKMDMSGGGGSGEGGRGIFDDYEEDDDDY